MKKLLSLLSVLTISGTAVPTTIAASPYQKEEKTTDNLEILNRNKRDNNLDNIYWIDSNKNPRRDHDVPYPVTTMQVMPNPKYDNYSGSWSIGEKDIYFGTTNGLYLLKYNGSTSKINGIDGPIALVQYFDYGSVHVITQTCLEKQYLFKRQFNNSQNSSQDQCTQTENSSFIILSAEELNVLIDNRVNNRIDEIVRNTQNINNQERIRSFWGILGINLLLGSAVGFGVGAFDAAMIQIFHNEQVTWRAISEGGTYTGPIGTIAGILSTYTFNNFANLIYDFIERNWNYFSNRLRNLNNRLRIAFYPNEQNAQIQIVDLSNNVLERYNL